MHEGDKEALRKMREDREVQKAAAQALDGYINRLRDALWPFALIRADDGDDFSGWHDDVIIRCEITVGDLRKAREALNAKS